MIIRILKPFFKWQPGAEPDVTEDLGFDLIRQGIAVEASDQTRRDLHAKPKEETQSQQIEVNNYYTQEPKKKRGFFTNKS
jgi:hypothetical protein